MKWVTKILTFFMIFNFFRCTCICSVIFKHMMTRTNVCFRCEKPTSSAPGSCFDLPHSWRPQICSLEQTSTTGIINTSVVIALEICCHSKYFFLKSLILTKAALFDKKTTVLWNILGLFRQLFSLLIYLKCNFIHVMAKQNFQHNCSRVTWFFRNHSNMLICCSRNISYYYQCWKQLYFWLI